MCVLVRNALSECLDIGDRRDPGLDQSIIRCFEALLGWECVVTPVAVRGVIHLYRPPSLEGKKNRPDDTSSEEGGLREAALSALRTVTGGQSLNPESEESGDSEDSQTDSGETPDVGEAAALDPDQIAMVTQVKAPQAAKLAEVFDSYEAIADAAEAGTLDDIDNIGSGTVRSVSENADDLRSRA